MPTPAAARKEMTERVDIPVSAVVPGAAVAFLAALWLMSVPGHWVDAAFCSDRGLGLACRAHVNSAVPWSGGIAAAAALLSAAAVLTPVLTRSAGTARIARLRMLTASAACWLLALAVFFIAGETASH
jgi:hypothetical protein